MAFEADKACDDRWAPLGRSMTATAAMGSTTVTAQMLMAYSLARVQVSVFPPLSSHSEERQAALLLHTSFSIHSPAVLLGSQPAATTNTLLI